MIADQPFAVVSYLPHELRLTTVRNQPGRNPGQRKNHEFPLWPTRSLLKPVFSAAKKRARHLGVCASLDAANRRSFVHRRRFRTERRKASESGALAAAHAAHQEQGACNNGDELTPGTITDTRSALVCLLTRGIPCMSAHAPHGLNLFRLFAPSQNEYCKAKRVWILLPQKGIVL